MTTNEKNEFHGKVAFVTGAAQGIGRATALAFARNGASVALADVSDKARETARMIEALGGRALVVSCDVAKSQDVKSALNNVAGTFGRLDFAFNNAGVEQPVKAVTDISDDEWDRLMAINLRGVFLCL